MKILSSTALALAFLLFFSVLQENDSVWHNAEIEKYPMYLQRLQQTGQKTIDLEDTLTETKTHIYTIVTEAQVRQEHMRDFLATSLLPSLNRSSYFTQVAAVELSAEVPLYSFVARGVLSWDYNATWRHQRMNHGRLACQLSLVHTLELFLNSSHKNALIFEDDVTVTPGLSSSAARSLTAQLLRVAPSRWDLLYLGYCHSCDSPGGTSTGGKGTSTLPWLSADPLALCAHAIVFNRRAASLFLRHWYPLHSPGDNKLSQVVCERGLKVLRPVLPVFDQDRSIGKSQTGTRNKPLLPFLSPQTCQKRQLNCPATRAAAQGAGRYFQSRTRIRGGRMGSYGRGT